MTGESLSNVVRTQFFKYASPAMPIFLDHQSTTPVDPKVFEAMKPFFLDSFGNPSSRTHSWGWDAAEAVENARKQVATLLGCLPNEVVFTSGATESLNLAILGLAKYKLFKGHIITTQAEHKASLTPCQEAERLGVKVTYLPVDSYGQVSVEQVENALRDDTFLVNIIHANNEIGTLNPIEGIAKLCHDRGVIFLTDATQSVGRVPMDVKKNKIGLLSLSAHKIYGPKGVGALMVSRTEPRVRLAPLSLGGGQENGLRAGTLNVPGIVGLGTACEIYCDSQKTEWEFTTKLRDRFLEGIQSVPYKINGHLERRLPHNLSLTLKDVPTRELLSRVHRKLALSTGSSCSSETGETSHVLKAIGLSESESRCTVRVGFGRFTTLEDAETAGAILREAVNSL